jgi:hypothetical protein
MERVITLSDRVREPEAPASTVKVAHLGAAVFHNERNREVGGVKP